ncbi:uncharacterized protein EV422DRAFT_594041 [Fimicolochytrium jonesii]|uniref:uncharacterized protein n=1 Tax=Fimicolochytrium jonesii TaxID=1396493 RepID=UPI0022FF0131|nr:uncharacterized protein EV422DRAFT_594041 [Fimicolochytrium jonesii]KAI8827140.1 hypothetical protein EV422DRAFT_594041 [Fimicolochytrium jonesii]
MPHDEIAHSCQGHRGGAGGDFAQPGVLPSYAPDTVIVSKHIDIGLDFAEIRNKRVKATISHTFVNNHAKNDSLKSKALSFVKLNGVGFIDLDVKGEGLTTWVYDGREISLLWDKPFSGNEERNVQLTYTVDDPVSGLYFEVPRKEYPNRVLHAITDHEPERCRHWLACVDFPAVRATLSFALRHEEGMTAVANGVSQGETKNDDGSITSKWHLDLPCPSYLICLAVGFLESVDAGQSPNGVPVKFFAPKGTPHEDLKRLFGQTKNMLAYLPQKFGVDFPFPKYYQVCSYSIGGAMENISLVSWNAVILMDEIRAKELLLDYQRVDVHEMAHSYFGDLLVIRHFEHVWLKEGWAKYTEALWLEDKVSKEEFEAAMVVMQDRYFAESKQYQRPIVTRIFDSSWHVFDSHTYPGGAWRLHMLRKLLGDGAFWAGVQDYIKTYQRSVVETDDFRKCLEKASGVALVKFFDDWLYSPGYPKLKGTYSYELEKNLVVLTLEQTQVDAAKKIPLFDIVIPVTVTDANGKTHSADVVFDSRTKNTKAIVAIPVSGKPVSLSVDPDYRTIFSLDLNPGEEVLSETAKSVSDVRSRIWAYQQLIEIGTLSALKKVKENILQEKFYRVRATVAAALRKCNTQRAIDVQVAIFKAETHQFALRDAANFTEADEGIRSALLEFLNKKTMSERGYGATGRALESLARQRNPDDVKFLLEVAQDEKWLGQHGLVRSDALRALGSSRAPEAFDYLLTRLQPGVEFERARPAVISAIASSAPWQSASKFKEATELIINHLRDSQSSVRRSAISSLCGPALNARAAAGKIKATRGLYDDREWEEISASLRALQARGDPVPGGAIVTQQELVKTVEELQSRLRKLEDKIAEKEAKDKEAWQVVQAASL